MSASKALDVYLKKCPFAVLTQASVLGVIKEDFDQIFEASGSQEYKRHLMFSAMATAVADVVLRFAGNYRRSYAAYKDKLLDALFNFYDQIDATELPISEAIAARSAQRAAAMQDQLSVRPVEVLPGYRVFALDGNHLPERRKRARRSLHDAPLPGTVVARLDLQRRLFDRAYLLEDAHAEQSTVLDRALEDLQAGEVLVADRHYCILSFLQAAEEKGVGFVIRQHDQFEGVLEGSRREIGRIETGTVYEQVIKFGSPADAWTMRRITVKLDARTRGGAAAIHLMTNLPADVDALLIADAYRHRWEEETGYCHLSTTLTCELASESDTQTALFLFSLAMMAFNIRQVVFAALYAEHDDQLVNEVSCHSISVEISRYTDGMLIALDDAFWQRTLSGTTADLAKTLRAFARQIHLKGYCKSKRVPKKKAAKPPG